MANARAAYYAARLSLQTLVGSSAWAYLWTLTFPEAKDAATGLRHWRKLVHNWKELQAFRVVEKHPLGHGYHIHFVTASRLDVNDVRKRSERHGFGRINVTRIPADRVFYVVKYLLKGVRASTGRRMWATVGYQGVRSSDVEIRDSFWKEVFSFVLPNGYSLGARRQLGLQRIVARMFHRDANEEKQTMKPEHHASVLKRIENGETVVVGEYRSTKVDTFEMNVKDKPGMKVERVILRHAVESGPNTSFVTEWTPEGTRKEDVKFPLKKGQMVLIAVKKMIAEKGVVSLSGELVPLL